MKNQSYLLTILVLIFSIGVAPITATAQMERERVNPGGPVEGLFWAPNIAGLGTVYQLDKGTMNVTIMHNFGIATDRTLANFFGLDIAPNVRLGLDFGITDNWSVGIGRTTNQKVVDFRTKLSLLRQQSDGSMPLSLSLKGDLGLITVENNRPLSDDLSFLLSVPIARKFGDGFSLQATPMVGHFNRVESAANEVNTLYSVALGAQYDLSRRYALIAEYYPVIGDRNPGTHNAFTLGVNIETGGHVFQLYFASARWHTEQFILAENRDDFWAGDFRIGFNVNRLFSL